MTNLPARASLVNAAHDRRKARNRTAAQIIAVGKSAGQHNRVETLERVLFVPDVFGTQAFDAVYSGNAILIAVGPGKLNDGKLHSDS